MTPTKFYSHDEPKQRPCDVTLLQSVTSIAAELKITLFLSAIILGFDLIG